MIVEDFTFSISIFNFSFSSKKIYLYAEMMSSHFLRYYFALKTFPFLHKALQVHIVTHHTKDYYFLP